MENYKGEEKRESYESASAIRQEVKEVRKRLSFLDNNDKVENTFAESNRAASQCESFSATGRMVDETYADATVLSFSNKNDEDSVSIGSQHTEKSNSDTSPERNYGSVKHKLRKSMKVHDIIPETDFEDEEDTCNTTFSQCINKKLEDQNSQSLSLDMSIAPSPKNASITITTKYKPPDPERIRESMTLYGIPKCRSQKPFFSNKCDLAKQKESASTSTSTACFDAPAFKSSIEDVTSLGLWRRMKVNEFHPSGAAIKTNRIKRTLAGYGLLTIKPLVAPPSSKDVANWIKAKKYLSRKESDETKMHERDKKKVVNVQGAQHPQIVAETSLNDSANDNSAVRKSVSLTPQQIESSGTSEFTQGSNKSRTSDDSLNPSLQKALQNPLLYEQNKVHQQLGASYGEIECLAKASYGNVSSENLQNARAISAVSVFFFTLIYAYRLKRISISRLIFVNHLQHQHLTLLSLEVHVVTRGNLLPDPQYDPVAAIFYAVHNDDPRNADQIEHGKYRERN